MELKKKNQSSEGLKRKMKNEAKEEYEFYYKILADLNYSEIKFGEINDVKRTYENICQDIIDSRINKYLKYEKKLNKL